MNADERRCLRLIAKGVHYASPLDLRFAEINEQTHCSSRGLQVVQTLRCVLLREMFDTFQLDHEHVFDENIGEVFTDASSFISDWKGSLGDGVDAPEPEFHQKRPLIDLFQEPGAEGIRNLKHGSEDSLRKPINNICVHLRSSAAINLCRREPNLLRES